VKPEPTGEFAFASSVAAFGMILRRSEHKGDASYALVRQLAARGAGQDGQGYRREFLGLVDKAAGLDGGGSVEVAR
jgi:Ca-activated chloride channel family protein